MGNFCSAAEVYSLDLTLRLSLHNMYLRLALFHGHVVDNENFQRVGAFSIRFERYSSHVSIHFLQQDSIIKTLISAHPILKHNYRTCFPNHNKGSGCFEILGFDILLDKKLKPWVIEVSDFSSSKVLDRSVVVLSLF